MSTFKKKILGFIGDKILAPATISGVQNLSPHFRMIEIESPSFSSLTWRPGEKLQVNTGDWNVRTYTPLSLDPVQRKIKILTFLHGQGPGSEWASSVKVGAACQVLGPRSSLDLPVEEGPLILFGDETSFAVASTFKSSGRSAQFIFEVNAAKECSDILDQINITESHLVPKSESDAHLGEVLKKIKENHSLTNISRLVLTGRAQSIQKLRNLLKVENLPFTSNKVKAYWSEGKVGLD